MNQTEKNKALEILGDGIRRLIQDYSYNALLINACFIAKDRYQNIGSEFVRLSTTQNIPEPLRLEMEIDMTYNATELVDKYTNSVNEVICTNYVVTTVSTVDAILEDLYEYLYKLSNPTATEQDIEKVIRNAWTNENMLNFFSDPNGLNLQKPAGLNTEFREAFMRYSELRIVRHTLLHSNRQLSPKNQAKLKEYFDLTPPQRQHFALINAPFFDKDKRISLGVVDILSIRKYAFTFLMFMRRSIDELLLA